MPPPVELLERVPLFAGLERKELENLTRWFKERRFQAGETVAAEGKGGVGFFLIEDGEARVTVGGTERGRLGPGDYFGEIALLRGVPRTATVTATTPARLYALGRDEFLSTVLGMRCAQREAARFATQRLGHGAHLIPRAP